MLETRPVRSPADSALRLMLETALDAVIIADQAGRIMGWNAQAEQMFGWSAGEVVGREIADLIIPEAQRAAHRAGLARFLETGVGPILGRRIEVTAVDRAGREVPVELAIASLKRGDEWMFCAFVRDLSQSREAERAHRIEMATLRIAEAAIAVPDLLGLLRSVHEIIGELMDATNFYVALLDDATGELTFPYFVDEVDAAPARKRPGRGLTEYVMRTGQPQLITPERHRELERAGEVELIGAPSIDWLGVPLTIHDQVIGALVVQTYREGIRFSTREQRMLQFVSTQVAAAVQRVRAEERLKDSETKYRMLFERNPAAVWLYDQRTLRFLAVNDAAVRRYGYSQGELLAMKVTDIEVEDGKRHRRKTGELLDVDISADFIEMGGRDVVLMLVRDVTAQRRIEGQLAQAQRLEAIGQLAGGIAHDFNNLLTAVTGYSDLLLADMPPSDQRRHDVEEIRKASESAGALTQQLLAFSRRQVLQPRILDLNESVRSSEKLLRRLIGETIVLRTSLTTPLGAVKADPAQMEQVIINLAVNARDAMESGGELVIETFNQSHAAGTAGSEIPAGDWVCLQVRDNGIGMDEATRARLFEPFFTTKAMGKGTGLGLATVYGVVQQSDGVITVRSEKGKGSSFRIWLPRVMLEPEPLRSSIDAAPPKGKETILLVEDEPTIRAVVQRTLERQGYSVLVAVDGTSALELLGRTPGAIDLLLTDVIMPGLSGKDLAVEVKRRRPGTRVLYISGYSEEIVAHHGVLDEGIAYLAKPFTPGVLARKVRETLDS